MSQPFPATKSQQRNIQLHPPSASQLSAISDSNRSLTSFPFVQPSFEIGEITGSRGSSIPAFPTGAIVGPAGLNSILQSSHNGDEVFRLGGFSFLREGGELVDIGQRDEDMDKQYYKSINYAEVEKAMMESGHAHVTHVLNALSASVFPNPKDNGPKSSQPPNVPLGASQSLDSTTPEENTAAAAKRKQRQEAVKRCRRRKNEEIENLKNSISKLKAENALLAKRMKTIVESQRKSADGATAPEAKELVEEISTAREISEKRIKLLREVWEAINCGGIQELRDMAPDLYHRDYTMINPDVSIDIVGAANAVSYWARIWDSFPDGLIEIKEIVPLDPYGEKLRSRVILSGTHIGPVFGIMPTKKFLSLQCHVTTSWIGLKIVKDEWMWNASGIMLTLLGIPAVH